MSNFGSLHRRPNPPRADFDSGILPPNLHTTVPRRACIRGVLKVKVEVNGHVIRAVSSCHIASSHGQMARSPPNIHSKVPGRACTQNDLKVTVKVKGHVIRALLSCHENRLFSRANCSIPNKLSHNVCRAGLHPGCAQGQGRGQRSRDTGSFVLSQKLLLLAGKWLDRHRTFTARSVSYTHLTLPTNREV